MPTAFDQKSLGWFAGQCRAKQQLWKRKFAARDFGGQDYIETIWGRGHALREPTKQAIAS